MLASFLVQFGINNNWNFVRQQPRYSYQISQLKHVATNTYIRPITTFFLSYIIARKSRRKMRFRPRTFAYSVLKVKAYFNFLKHRGSQSWNLNTVNSWHLILSRYGGHYYNLCESTHISLFNVENSVLKRCYSGHVWWFLVKRHFRSFEKKMTSDEKKFNKIN